jgi:prepilin peptidase CpaA
VTLPVVAGLPLWALAALLLLVVAAAIIDVRTGKVPNWLTVPALAVGLAGHALTGGLHGDAEHMGLLSSLAGFGIGFGLMLIFQVAGGIGGGDTKLMGAIGALCGWQLTVSVMMYSFIIAALMAVVVMVRKRLVRRTLRRVWTALALAFGGARPADPTSSDSPTVPVAVAFCLGTVAALASVLLRRWLGMAA